MDFSCPFGHEAIENSLKMSVTLSYHYEIVRRAALQICLLINFVIWFSKLVVIKLTSGNVLWLGVMILGNRVRIGSFSVDYLGIGLLFILNGGGFLVVWVS